MNKVILTILILVGIKVNSQVYTDLRFNYKIYQEPQSILVIKNRNQNLNNIGVGATFLIVGFLSTSLYIQEQSFTYYPHQPSFISKKIRPYLMPIGIGCSFTGLYFLLK